MHIALMQCCCCRSLGRVQLLIESGVLGEDCMKAIEACRCKQGKRKGGKRVVIAAVYIDSSEADMNRLIFNSDSCMKEEQLKTFVINTLKKDDPTLKDEKANNFARGLRQLRSFKKRTRQLRQPRKLEDQTGRRVDIFYGRAQGEEHFNFEKTSAAAPSKQG